MELLLPSVQVPVLKHPSYEKLDMAFGVGAGTSLFDKSRYRSHGAITGASWAAGLHGYCLDFDPTIPSHVIIPAAYTQLDFTSEDFSMVARVKVDDLTFDRYVFTRGLFRVDGYDFYVHNTGMIVLGTNQAAARQASFSTAGGIVVATWYTIGCSRSGASVKIYEDGVEDTATAAVHINPLTSARTAKIGIHGDLVTGPYDGKIEFLRIFGGIALSTSEHLA